MKPTIYPVPLELDKSRNRQFVLAMETESLIVACQKIEGPHTFHHLNEKHDEILHVLSGQLEVWTSEGTHTLKAGDLLKIPKGVEHGDLIGTNAQILIIEGKL